MFSDFEKSGTSTKTFSYVEPEVKTLAKTKTCTPEEEEGILEKVGVKDGVWPLEDTYPDRLNSQLPKSILNLMRTVSSRVPLTTIESEPDSFKQTLAIDIGPGSYGNTSMEAFKAVSIPDKANGIPGALGTKMIALEANKEVLRNLRNNVHFPGIVGIQGNGWRIKESLEAAKDLHLEKLEDRFGLIIAANSLALSVYPNHNSEPEQIKKDRIKNFYDDLISLLSPGIQEGSVGGIAVLAVGSAALAIGCVKEGEKKFLTVEDDYWFETEGSIYGNNPSQNTVFRTNAFGIFIDCLNEMSEENNPIVKKIPKIPQINKIPGPFNYAAHVPIKLIN